MSVQQPRRGVQWLTVIVAVLVTLGVLSYLIYIGYGLRWTGFGPSRVSGEVQPGKTLWEWLGLLFVPTILALGGFLLNRWQKQHEDRIQQAQEQQQQLIEEARREREEAAAIQRAQDEALRAYLDQMSNLMVDRELRKKLREKKLREEPEDPDEHTLAQARTLAILLGLGRERKKIPLKLIYELRLITKEEPILNLRNAGLDTADLSEITLHEACLSEADLRRANLSGADLKGTDLTRADLRGADLSDADLSDTMLAGANLLPYDEKAPAKLNAPNLSNGTDPSDVDLSDNKLVPTNLVNANLSGADLSGAYLTGTKLAPEQLAACKSLEGATMPDGQILRSDDNPKGSTFEDWLKSKDRGEDEKNSSPS
jgi:uncharacterized protein YjbI with pentapeptide repeats